MNRLRNCLASLTIAAAFAAPVMAQSATDALYDCAGIANATERLACYDRAVASLRAAETSGDVVTFTTEELEAANADSFGRSPREADGVDQKLAAAAVPDEAPNEVTAGITDIDETRGGKLIVTLDNGQIWLQTDSSAVNVSRKKPPAEAVVKKAALGSFRVKLGRSRAFRARRID
ncbi:MAG: hypothetical protein AAF253_13375 [Pseudomonadota bacterium]